MGVEGLCESNDEITRGEPGYPLVGADLELVKLKPLKVFTKGEIVAVKNEGPTSGLVYGAVVEGGGGASLSRLRVQVGKGREVDLISSEVFSLESGAKSTRPNDKACDSNFQELSGANSILRSTHNSEDDLELTLTTNGDDKNAATNQSALLPVDRGDIVHAVQDLLKSANLSLDDDVKNVMESNLELRDQIAQKEIHMESLVNEGRILAKNMSKGMDVFLCPITRELMEDPVICADGHTYERYAIEMWLRTNSRSPKTNQPLSSTQLIPNHALRNTIEAMTESMDAVKKFANTYN
uniref:U-box domain-containing protein n=1 Tax=Helicotheca tamesis TaxID=374047 RepID=A0A7S2DZP0_9STRA